MQLISTRGISRRAVRIIVAVIVVALLTLFIPHLLKQPSNDRSWAADQAILPSVSFASSSVTITNIRDFTYTSSTTYTPNYYNETYDLERIKSVDFVFVPFKATTAAAHTFLTFGFDDGKQVAISVEIRKEVDEEYSIWKGMLRNYEISYVIASERDVIYLRAKHRDDEVFLYPVKTSKERMRTLFLDMLTRAETLRAHPEFYNTLTNNCTNNIAAHVNKLFPGRIPYNWRITFPGKADEYAYELGLIDTDLPFEEARTIFNISQRANAYNPATTDTDFSTYLRTKY